MPAHVASRVLPWRGVYVVLAVVLSGPSSSAAAAWHSCTTGWARGSSTKTLTTAAAATATTRTTTTALGMTAMRRRYQRLTKQQQQESVEKEKETKSNRRRQQKSILDDGYGHVNPDLAANLWAWEQQHRENAKLPKVSFSTRQGLRLVDAIVTEIATSPRGRRLLDKNEDIRTDLVQEGIIALMDALNEYRRRQSALGTSTSGTSDDDFDDEQDTLDFETNTLHNLHIATSTGSSDDDDDDPNAQFEAFARPYLQERLWATLDKTSRPVQLPEAETILWKYIQQIRPKLQAELGGRDPTTQELAKRLELPTETLQRLLASRRGVLSMESTVEIITPESLEDQNAHYTDFDSWEAREGHSLSSLDTSSSSSASSSSSSNKNSHRHKEDVVLVEEFQDEDESYQYEGEDEMWIHQTQIAAPLRDIIPDGASPDDVALSDMIRHNVGKFLSKTLSPEEVKVVRMAFGLDAAQKAAEESPLSLWEEIAYPLNMEPLEVKKVLRGAVRKLRMAYRSDYLSVDDDRDFFDDAESV